MIRRIIRERYTSGYEADTEDNGTPPHPIKKEFNTAIDDPSHAPTAAGLPSHLAGLFVGDGI